MNCDKRCLECPFYIDNADKLALMGDESYLENACYGLTPDGKSPLVETKKRMP